MSDLLLMPRKLKELFLRTVFLGEEVPPMFLGLTTKLFEFEPTIDSLLDAEPDPDVAIGYSRLLLSPSDWVFMSEPLAVTAQNPQFRNNGEARWPLIHMWFITNTFSGSGEVLVWDRFREARTLTNLDSLLVPIELQFPG